jgi:hypothetical protein
MIQGLSFSFDSSTPHDTPIGNGSVEFLTTLVGEGDTVYVTGHPTSLISLSNGAIPPGRNGVTHALMQKMMDASRQTDRDQNQPVQVWIAPNILSPDIDEQAGAVTLAQSIGTCRDIPEFNRNFIALVPDVRADQGVRDRMLMRSVPGSLQTDTNFNVLTGLAHTFQTRINHPHCFNYVPGNTRHKGALYGTALQMYHRETDLVASARNLQLGLEPQSRHAHDFEKLATAVQKGDSETLRDMGFTRMGALEYADHVRQHLHAHGRDVSGSLRFDGSGR